MKVIVKVTMWDIDGDHYLSYTTADSDEYELRANQGSAVTFLTCTAAWEALASLKGVGNVRSAELVEV